MNQQDDQTALSQVEEKKPNALSLLKSWDFSALFLGGFISNIGSYFTSIAIFFFALEITENLTATEATRLIALMTTFSLIPVFILGPIAGVLVDKFDRKKVMIIADLFAAVAVISLMFSSKMWHLYLIFFMKQLFLYIMQHLLEPDYFAYTGNEWEHNPDGTKFSRT